MIKSHGECRFGVGNEEPDVLDARAMHFDVLGDLMITILSACDDELDLI